MSRLPIQITLGGKTTAIRFAGAPLSDDERVALLNRLRTEHVELDIDITAYVQEDDRVLNDYYVVVDVDSGTLQALADSSVGKPFLKDHCEIQAYKGGRILEASIDSQGGRHELRQTIRVSAEWAVRGVLDQTIEQFSIQFTGKAVCSICANSFYHCDHWPGEYVEVDGEPVQVLIVYMSAEFVETSAVVFGGCQGTGIDACRTALTALRENPAGEANRRRAIPPAPAGQPEEDDMSMSKEGKVALTAVCLQQLGLTAAATPKNIETAVVTMAEKLSAAEAEATKLRADHAKLVAELDAQRAAAEDAFIRQALDSGKVLKDTPLETTLRRSFRASPDDARCVLAGLAVVHPGKAGQPHPIDLPAPKGDPPAPPVPDNDNDDDDDNPESIAAAMCAATGMPAEKFARYAPRGDR